VRFQNQGKWFDGPRYKVSGEGEGEGKKDWKLQKIPQIIADLNFEFCPKGQGKYLRSPQVMHQ
jgi:hypothetical protein